MEKKAEFIMKKAIRRIKGEFPPLIYALNLLPLKSTDKNIAIGTDKEYLSYHPENLMNEYQYGGMKRIVYLILHTVMHGLLGHWEMDGTYGLRGTFWIAIDREVGHLLEELDYLDQAVQDANEELSEFLGECYDIGVYFRICKNKRLQKKILQKYCAAYLGIDCHELWKKRKTKQKKSKKEEKSKKWEQARAVFSDTNGKADRKRVAGILKLSRRNQLAGVKGTGYGNTVVGIDAAKENENSYYQMLMQFLKNTKEQKATPEAIDYTLYQYGLELYGDVPLIEPPDSEELLELNTICLAIDTSGSCSGEVAEAFLRETYNLFRDLQNISSGGELYLFQCDEQIQREEYYERIEDLAEVIDQKQTFYGFGGTSFVPVFTRIGELEEEGKKIDCLIYLSDAYGDFPKEEPEYPVFFVLDESEGNIKNSYWIKNNVPKWVKLIGIGKE